MEKKKELPLTLQNDEGPYYSKGSPENSLLWSAKIPGLRVTLRGRVMDAGGRPLAGAWLDFWQADGKGDYDNKGYVLRGHQFADEEGNYRLETVIPGSYPGRTPHFHAKARASEKSPILTTQLFIPGIASNEGDFLYKKELLVKIEESPASKTATYDFVLET